MESKFLIATVLTATENHKAEKHCVFFYGNTNFKL
jgi:hypothetical protein